MALDDDFSGGGAAVVIRRHWAVLLEPTARCLPVVGVGLSLILLAPGHGVTSLAGMLLALVALVAYALRVTEWWMRHFIVSRRRVLFTSGVIVRTVTLLPLLRITDLTWQETLLGQALGYGTFRFGSAGQDQALRPLPTPASHRDTEPLPPLRHDTQPLRRLPPQRG
jgi:membrane protein YdbS with pleckstrin-like domain